MTPEEADRLWEIKFDKASHDSEYGFIMSPYDAFEILKGFKSALREEIEKEKNRSLNQTTRSHADISYEFGLDFTLKLLDSLTPKK